MSCLDDSTVVRLLAGRLDDVARSRVEREIGHCSHCAALVAEVLRGSVTLLASSNVSPASSESVARGSVRGPGDHATGDHDAAEDAPEDAIHGSGDEPAASRYELGTEIARGGMGTIFGAFDRRLARTIAIKRLASDDAGLAARFAREIRITASLQHPGIVPVYDSGALPDGRPFYAMRHVPGATLERAIGECRGDRERLGLLASVLAAAEAVAYAHERGIIHRDLKPSNVLVGPFGETVVIDWGLARIDGSSLDEVVGSEPPVDPLATSLGSIVGTPRYMAPEQARGEPATRRSDVYALGAILYHTLTGVPPIAGDNVKAILERVARAEVEPLAKIAPRLPGDLIAIVERAMAVDPERRYASAGELAADLRRFQTGQLVRAYSYSRRELARRFVRRHRGVLALATLFAAVLAVGGTLSVRRIVTEREQAELERVRAERERHGAENLVQYLLHELREKLATVGRLDVLSGVADRVEAYYLTTAAGRADLPETVVERAALYGLRAAVASGAGDGPATDRYLDQGLALVDRVPSTSRSKEIRSELVNSKAARSSQTGQFQQARALYEESVTLERQVTAASTEDGRRQRLNLAGRLTGAAKVADRLGDIAGAEREWKEAADVLEQLRKDSADDPELTGRIADIQLALGQSRYRRGQLRESLDALDKALSAIRMLRVREPKNERFAWVHAWSCLTLGNVRQSQGEHAEAQRLDEEAREVALAMVAIEPASAKWQGTLSRAETDLGTAAYSRSDWASAARHFEAARVIDEQLVARDPESRDHRRATAITIAQLADAEAALGHIDAARSAWQAALTHLERLAATQTLEGRLEWAFGLRGAAIVDRRSRRLTSAATAIERAVMLIDQTPGRDDRPTYTYYRAAVVAEAGNVRAAQHRRAEAMQFWKRSAGLLQELAAKEQFEPDWSQLLREVEAQLAPRGGRAQPGARGQRR